MYNNALVIGVDCLSRITDYTDRNTCVLFGDGAGAAIVGEVPEGRGFQAFDLGAEGAGGAHLYIEAGGSRLPASAETINTNKHFIYMNGREVFKFAVRVMGSATEAVLSKAGIDKRISTYSFLIKRTSGSLSLPWSAWSFRKRKS